MDPEEQELFSDYRYRNYSSVIEKALRNFESSSEWADLISSLGRLNKALQSNLTYSLLPRRLIISKRLAQCLHPALPSGVHLKALETYEIIFKIIGTKWLAKDLFLYSCGLFPLLTNGAVSVRPVLLGLYEKYFLPLKKLLLPSLQAFVIGLLPGLEEGSEIYDRTDALLLRLSLVVGKDVFYTALWGAVAVSPSIRLPASLFIVSHIQRELPGQEQTYMLGTDYQLTIKSLCASLLDSNVLVQRNNLEIVLFFFPFYTCLDSDKSAIPLLRSDIIRILSAAAQTLLRRDMSLNRRFYAWLLGSDIKGNTLVPASNVSASYEDQSIYFFEKYSKELLVEALIEILHQKFTGSEFEESQQAYLKPFRILVSLLDKPEIGPQVVGDLFLEVIRALYSYCRDALGIDLKPSYTQSGNLLTSAIKENKYASEIVKTVNFLITSLSTDFIWDYMTRCFEDCFRSMEVNYPFAKNSTSPTVSELCVLLVFLLDVIPLELYSEVQTQYLPQMLSYMVQCLYEELEFLTLPELTHALKTCFKVLSKVQMPPSYLDIETQNENPLKGENPRIVLETKSAIPDDDDDASFPPLKSEDSGIGLSASSPELSQHLGIPKISPEKDDVWKRNGSMQKTLHYLQELVTTFTNKHIFGVQLPERGEENQSMVTISPKDKDEANITIIENSGKKRSLLETKAITVPQFKQMLSDLFTVRVSPTKQKRPSFSSTHNLGKKKEKEEEEWYIYKVIIDLGDLSKDCQEAFASACRFLLDCSTFPVYLSQEETEHLYTSLFQAPGKCESSFPMWLKSLMTICCCVNDCQIQNVSIFTLLEIISHSQSLALVCEDRMKRSKISGSNPLFGKLQMVTVPPIVPGILKVIAKKTDFYQRVAQVLWNQLNKDTQEHHIACVELFYKLHCLAPSPNICEDIICHSLLEPDKGTRLEAIFRFSIIWHLTREIQSNRVTSHSRSFDRSLFVVLDSLTCSDEAIGAAAQGWLVRALSLNDVSRILEPVLLFLLHPKTQRISIHCIKRKNSAEDLHHWFSKKKACFKELYGVSELPEGSSCHENLPLNQFTTVDREAIWAEVEKDPEKLPLRNVPEDDDDDVPGCTDKAEGELQDNSEHTESADTSLGATESENTSSFSTPSLDPHELSSEENCSPVDDRVPPKHPASASLFQAQVSKTVAKRNLVRFDSDKTQASESLSSDEEADMHQTLTMSKLLKQKKEKQAMTEALFKHILLYLQPYDSKRVLYAFSVLETVLKSNPKEFIEAVSRTNMDTSSTAHLNLIYNLLARHQEALVGQSFYGKLQTQSPTTCPHSLLIELLIYLCLSFLRSYFPCYVQVSHRDILGNQAVQIKSVEVLIRIMSQLTNVAKLFKGKNVDFIQNLLEQCKVQEFVLLSLSVSMFSSQKQYELLASAPTKPPREERLFEEGLISFGQDTIWNPLQIELLKLLQVLIILEHHLGKVQEELENQSDLSKEWQKTLRFQESISAMQYVQPHPITSQGLFISAVVRGLQPECGYGMHSAWVSLVTSSLPYFGKSLGWTVAPFVVQICKNLDELVRQYENEFVKSSVSIPCKRENVSPDYPLTLLEGLTTISHFCLLEQQPNQTKMSTSISDPINLRNAKNAILEELPRIVNTMSLLWSVIRKEETQKRQADFFGSSKGSSLVYFKATKTIRQKILDFLNPLGIQLGVQLIAAVAAVWSRKKVKHHSKIVPVASSSQLTLVDLISSLNTLKTDTILYLVKEVVKKPSQIKGEEKSSLVDIPVLHFSYTYLQRLPISVLQENFPSLLGVLKESVQLNLAPPGYFLLLSMLNDFVTRTPNLESKKDQKDLQDITQKILEAVGNIAGSSLEQTSWLSRNLEVKAQPQISLDECDAEEDLHDAAAAPSSMVSASAPSVYSVHALSLLAEVVACLLDMIYRSDEKEKAVPLISRLLYYVFPYLRNHSTYNTPSFRAGSQLLSSLSSYAYTKRAWKKEVLELYLDPAFFQMDTSCVHWRSIIDHLLTHEKTMFKDLMNMQSSSLKLFSSFEQKAMLLKRQAFAVFSGDVDQYHLYLPLIQERLTENLRVGQTSLVAAQMFLFFRVLLLRISPQHLTSLWPIMVTELIQTFIQFEDDLKQRNESSKSNNKVNRMRASGADGSGPSLGEISQNELFLYLSACKFLDTALSFPPDKMPLFQMYKWAFVPEVDTKTSAFLSDLEEYHQECKPHVVRILELLNLKYGEINNTNETASLKCEFPLLHQHSISSIVQLMPFFRTLSCAFKTQSNLSHEYPRSSLAEFSIADGPKILKQLEESVECDFLENLEC
ncbi:protein dopey-2 [Gracilinanus agilis]|uniref:protein dopey-2 n=1 Tax=Gracilinanus agilis TaxID=191870 RepID=UPI001CFE9BC8|nr:protein dopey-2 [Gracilinanus agilis]